MSYVHNHVYTRLTTFAGLTALVSTRVYHQILPQQSTYPAVVYTEIVGRTFHDMQGKGGLRSSLFQFDTLGLDTDVLKSIAEQIRLALQGYSGTLLGVKIHGVRVLSDVDGPVDTDAKLHRVTQQFEVWHDESEPA